jgi:predicted DNA-binding transcriptional regulator AlpA
MKGVTSLEPIALQRTRHRPPSPAFRLYHALDWTGLSRSTVYRCESQGIFPARVKVGVRAVTWA